MDNLKKYINASRGHLTVLDVEGNNLICRCVCGNVITLPADKWMRSRTLSCGCRPISKHIFPRTCKTCGRDFEGGPHAQYCPDCRAERAKVADKESKQRARSGKTLTLGKNMQCEMCGKVCIRNSANQKYCTDCADKHIKEIDRKRALARYHAHKDDINQRRNELRRLKMEDGNGRK